MRAAFLIDRPTQYRLLGPVIDEALDRGWSVECWHDERRPGHFLKSGAGADAVRPPRFRHGQPVVRPFVSNHDLDVRLRDAAEVVVSIGAEPYYFRDGRSGPRPVWAWLQYVSDFLHHLGPDDLLSCDLTAFHSAWWQDWTAESYLAERKIPSQTAYAAALARRSVVTGIPEIDAARLMDPVEIRRRWGIPLDRPVVVLLPFPQGVGKAAFWPRHIFHEPSRVRQLWHVLARRRFEFWPDVVHGWNDRRVVQAIRAFCDRNDAFLLVKSRPKTPVPAYLQACADLTLYDDSHYPATILEALSIASLCVSFYSSAVVEAIPLHVPHLCIAFDMERYFDVDMVAKARALRLYHREAGSLHQFDGAAWTLSIPEALETLPSARLASFAMRPDARQAYIDKFVGFDDGRSSARFADAIAAAVALRSDQRDLRTARPS